MKKLNKLTEEEFKDLKEKKILKYIYPDAPDYYELLKHNIKIKNDKDIDNQIIKNMFDYLISYIIKTGNHINHEDLKYFVNNLISIYYNIDIEKFINDAVNDAVNDTVNDAVNDTVNDAVNDAVNDTFTINDIYKKITKKIIKKK